MKYFYFAALVALLLPHTSNAQEPVIAPDTEASDPTLDQWLHSKDPRPIAWAATLARQNHDSKIVAEMPDVLDSWTVAPPVRSSDDRAMQSRAIDAVFDALIQENATVPTATIGKFAQFFPAQAAILISRLPMSESRETLIDWTFDNEGRSGVGELARIASMLLAKDAKENVAFVANVVAASENRLEITVRAKYKKIPATGTGACGDGLGKPLDPGWPPVFIYGLDENLNETGIVVVDLNGDRIVAHRHQENLGWGSCGSPKPGIEPLDAETRYRLIAYWAGSAGYKMTWKPDEHLTIVWAGKAAYERRLGQIIELHRKELRETVDEIERLGLMTPDEASAFSPKIVITVECDMTPCPLDGRN